MALARHHLPRRLPRLAGEGVSLAADPPQLVDDGEPRGVVAHAEGDGDADAPIRGVHGEVDVPDVLPDDLDGDPAHFDVVTPLAHGHQ